MGEMSKAVHRMFPHLSPWPRFFTLEVNHVGKAISGPSDPDSRPRRRCALGHLQPSRRWRIAIGPTIAISAWKTLRQGSITMSPVSASLIRGSTTIEMDWRMRASGAATTTRIGTTAALTWEFTSARRLAPNVTCNRGRIGIRSGVLFSWPPRPLRGRRTGPRSGASRRGRAPAPQELRAGAGGNSCR